MTMKGFKFEPVRWMTIALAALTALIGANELVHDLTGNDIVPAGLTPYLLGAEALLALLLGKAVRDRVTPLAAPRDAADTPLVPKSMAGPAASSKLRPDGTIGSSGMSSW